MNGLRAELGRLGRLARKELSETLRDRRTVFTLVLMPLLLYPLLAIAFQQFLLGSRVGEMAPVYRVAVRPEEDRDVQKYLHSGDRLLPELAPEWDRLTTYGRRFVELARLLGPRDAKQAAQETIRFYRVIDRQVFAAGYDALITPTIASRCWLRGTSRCARASRSRRSTGSAATTAFTDGSGRARTRCVTPPGRSSAGSAPAPTWTR